MSCKYEIKVNQLLPLNSSINKKKVLQRILEMFYYYNNNRISKVKYSMIVKRYGETAKLRKYEFGNTKS